MSESERPRPGWFLDIRLVFPLALIIMHSGCATIVCAPLPQCVPLRVGGTPCEEETLPKMTRQRSVSSNTEGSST